VDPDVAIQRVLNSLFLLGGALVIGLVATWFVGWLCRRARLPNGLTLLAQLLTPVALFYSTSLYFDVAGIAAEGRVVSTEERISYGSHIPGSWSRAFWATVQIDSPSGPEKLLLWIDDERYDALRAGSPIVVRYLPWVPFIARPADQSTRALVPWRWLAIGGLVVAAGLVLRAILRRAPPLVQGLGILGAMLMAVTLLIFPTPWVTPLEPPVLTTTADVRDVRDVTRSFADMDSSVPAPQPWNLVELHFLPEGRSQEVVAVDGVDMGSVAGLQKGARLPVTYSARDPRDARLAGARTYRWREWQELGEWIVATVVVFGAFILLQKAAGAWWRRLTRRT
jgi:hypothetical protein